MKSLLTPILLSLFLTTISCSTEYVTVEPASENPESPVEETFVEENPLPQYLATTRYNELQVLCNDISTFHEVGFKFKAMEKGIINALTVKIPIINTNLIVTITNFTDNQIIRTESMNIVTANTETVKNIIPIELEKNKIYTITMKTNNYYKRFRADYSQPQYPVNVGNIKIIVPLSSAFSSDGSLGGSGNFYSGDCSFTFLRTE